MKKSRSYTDRLYLKTAKVQIKISKIKKSPSKFNHHSSKLILQLNRQNSRKLKKTNKFNHKYRKSLKLKLNIKQKPNTFPILKQFKYCLI